LAGMGYLAATNAANAFFYLLTALHGMHIFGGLVAWWRSAARVWRGAEIVDLRLGVELCAVYWHYLLLVWLVLFTLLSFT
jgi:cytochrome c oxidase subunit 3